MKPLTESVWIFTDVNTISVSLVHLAIIVRARDVLCVGNLLVESSILLKVGWNSKVFHFSIGNTTVRFTVYSYIYGKGGDLISGGGHGVLLM